MQQHSFPFFFFTSIMLDSHFRFWIDLINPATNNFCTSFTIYSSTLIWNTLASWATGLAPRFTLSICTTNPRSSLGISLYSHAKMSLNSFNSEINFDLSSFDNFELIEIGLSFYGSVPRFISFIFSSTDTCTSFFALVFSSSSVSLSSPVSF